MSTNQNTPSNQSGASLFPPPQADSVPEINSYLKPVPGPATPETDAEIRDLIGQQADVFADKVIQESRAVGDETGIDSLVERIEEQYFGEGDGAKAKNPLDRGVCVSITFRKWGNSSEGDKTKVFTEADKDMIRVGKYLLRSDEYNAICQYDNQTRKWIKKRSQPSLFKSGIYLVAKKFVKELNAKLKEFKEEREQLVNAFVAVYLSQKAQAEVDLKDQYNPRDYPSQEEMARLFGLEWNFVYFGTPESLKEVDPELFAQQAAKLDETMRNAGETLTEMMRAEGLKVLTNLVERLSEPEDGGKKKVLKGGAVQNVTDFLEFFQIKNDVTDDGDLARLVEQARAALTGTDGQFFDRKTLKDNDAVRSAVRDQLAGVVDNIQGLMTKKPMRKIVFDERDED